MKIVHDKEEILALLYEFDDVFIHNREKVLDYSAWAEKLAQFGVVATLTGEKETAGMAAFYCNDNKTHTGYISLFGVKKAYRGTGCAGRFLEEITSYIQAQGMGRINLEVDIDNPRAKHFYFGKGFSKLWETSSTCMLEKDFQENS